MCSFSSSLKYKIRLCFHYLFFSLDIHIMEGIIWSLFLLVVLPHSNIIGACWWNLCSTSINIKTVVLKTRFFWESFLLSASFVVVFFICYKPNPWFLSSLNKSIFNDLKCTGYNYSDYTGKVGTLFHLDYSMTWYRSGVSKFSLKAQILNILGCLGHLPLTL